MENEAFAPKEQMLHFPNIFKNMIFQRCQKALLWSKWFTEPFYVSIFCVFQEGGTIESVWIVYMSRDM